MPTPPERPPTPGTRAALSEPPASADAKPSPALLWSALVIVYLVWGSTYLGIRISVETIPPFAGAALRFAAAALILGAVIAARRGPRALRVTGRQLRAAALVGVL